MNADPQLRERLDRGTRGVRFDPEAELERVHTGAARRGRNRRLGALAFAAAIGLVAVILVWRLPVGDRGRTPGGGPPTGRIALERERGGERAVIQLDPETGEVSSLARAGERATGVVWSPGGERIAYIVREAAGRSAIVVARADGSDPLRIAEHEGAELPGPDVLNVSWSPDGRRIAYTGRAPGQGRTVIVVAADGSGEPTVLDGLWGDVAWSPDGERLLVSGFPAQEGERPFDLYTMRPDGTDLVQLTDDAAVEHDPAWSPDGRRIAFSTGAVYDQDVWVIDADGSNRRNLTGGWGGIDALPVWSPDGRWIAFASDRDATAAQLEANRSGDSIWTGLSLYAMRPDGTDVRLILDGDGGAVFPTSWTSSA